MKIENIKNKIKIDQLVGRERIESLVEGEITLPDHKPKIDKLISLDGEVEITNQLLKEDTLIVTGVVKFRTLYTTEEDEDQNIHALQSKTDFREEIILESSYDARAVVQAEIEHIEYTKLTDKKVGVKTVIDIQAKLQKEGTIEIIKDIEGGESIQTHKKSIKYNELVASNKTKNLVKDTFEIAEGRGDVLDILRIDADTKVSESRVVDGKVIVAGSVNCFIMYYSDDEDQTLSYISESIPFTHFVELSGAQKDMDYNLDIKVTDVNYDVRGDINGNLRIIDLETSVTIDAKVFAQSQQEIVIDAYSTERIFQVKSEDIKLSQTLAKHSLEEKLNGTIKVSGGEITKLCSVKSRPIMTDLRTLEEKVIVEGVVDLDIVYIGENQSLQISKSEIPFKLNVELEDSKDIDIDIEVQNIIENISYEKLNDSEIEVSIDLISNITVNAIKNIKMVVEATQKEEFINKNNRSSITIYLVQKGDTVWDIAKRYSTTVEDIKVTNDIEEDNLKVGDKIIIEKHIDTVLQAYA